MDVCDLSGSGIRGCKKEIPTVRSNEQVIFSLLASFPSPFTQFQRRIVFLSAPFRFFFFFFFSFSSNTFPLAAFSSSELRYLTPRTDLVCALPRLCLNSCCKHPLSLSQFRTNPEGLLRFLGLLVGFQDPIQILPCHSAQVMTMEILSLISALFLLVAALAYLFPKSNNSNKNKKGGKSNKHAQSTNATPFKNGTTYYTKEQVSKHNTRTDCWIIVKDKVYDVTSYVEEHPGADAILNNAGRDSTEGFYGPQHATRVFDMVDEFYIGDLKN
ncbi:hypothetical protein LUZ61_002205 [Rhynchospora tenuis]|uniref:Cytochrome b5 heme-binding domain-containing protein n=1 Tax=Rhynchospora tenuis TaxID=198213 RepID=A0AAD6ERP4_9POAL|nr:hypothetical protein LUZ61_002205 [Rhynchospora tenuis]